MIKVNELFSGIGAPRKALLNAGIEHTVVGISEIDKYAIQSYEAIYGPVRNYGDISIIDKLDYADLWTYGFPCQDISLSGKQAGITEETRSGLLFQVKRLLIAAENAGELPKWLLLENVKNLVGKKFKPDFDAWIEWLDQLGYVTYWKVLNGKNYGVPQNRERVIAFSIRKDIDDGTFEFPKPQDQGIRIKDILEEEVPDNFYITGKGFEAVQAVIPFDNRISLQQTNELIHVGNVTGISAFESGNRVYSVEGIAPTVLSTTGGRRRPKILLTTTKSGKTQTIELPCICASRGRYQENPQLRQAGLPTRQQIEVNVNGTSNTITTVAKDNLVITDEPAIRELTPLECWRLMGFEDEDFRKAKESGVSNTQLSKQAGNSIVVPMLQAIFEAALKDHHTVKCNYQVYKRGSEMNINEMVARAHDNAVKHGFWESPLEFGTAIALVHTELSEALEEMRAGNRIRPGSPTPMKYYSGGGYVADKPTKCSTKPEGVAVELADAVIRIADLCGHLGIDLESAIAEKMAYNEGREYKHGKQF